MWLKVRGQEGVLSLSLLLAGSQYYGPGGGYSFFAGRDASRAFVTGQFEEAGLVARVEGLSSSDYLGLEEWATFYEKEQPINYVMNYFCVNQKSAQHLRLM